MTLDGVYLMWNRENYDLFRIDRILEDGNPRFEDQQERLFVETVNTPICSYKVFSAFYLTHKYLPADYCSWLIRKR